MEQGSYGSGVRFFTLLNGIDDSRCLASFSFDYENVNYENNLVYPDSWNIYSATGILNKTGVNQLNQIAEFGLTTQSFPNYSASNDFNIFISSSSSGINIYKRITSNQWNLTQTLTGEGTGYYRFGEIPFISKDGKVLITNSIERLYLESPFGESFTTNIWIYTGDFNSSYILKKQVNVGEVTTPLIVFLPFTNNITDDNQTIVVTNPQHSGNYPLEGAAYFLTGSINNGWDLSDSIILGGKELERFGASSSNLYINNDASALVIGSNNFTGTPPFYTLSTYRLYTGNPVSGYTQKAELASYPGFFRQDQSSAFKFVGDKLIFANNKINSSTLSGVINIYTGVFGNFGLEKETLFPWLNEVDIDNRIVNYIDDDFSYFFSSDSAASSPNDRRVFCRYQINNSENRYNLDNNFPTITGGLYVAGNPQTKLLYDQNISQILVHNNIISGFQVYEYANPEIKNFYVNSGSATFNGENLMSFDRNLSLYRTDPRGIVFNSTLFLTFEKQRQQNEILVSSLGGTNFSNYSGFCLGINDANKLYFKYWNPIDGQFSYTFPNILANKNSIYLQTQQNEIIVGLLNNNTKSYEIGNFQVFRNTVKDSNNFILGGSNVLPEWLGNNVSNFSGLIDNFYLFRNLSSLDIKNITSGFIYNPININGEIIEECFTETALSGSGFFENEITGKLLFEGITGNYEVTGILSGFSGVISTGITGYEAIETQKYIDNCGNEIINYRYDPLTGIIITNVPFKLELTGYVERTGIFEIDLTGLVERFIDIEINTTICNDRLFLTGILEFSTGVKFLSGLSFSEISLISKLDAEDSLEAICENYTHDNLLFNKTLDYDIFNQNHYYNEDINITGIDQIMLFANGQLLINSGFYVQETGYDINIITNLDYAVTGNDIYTNKKFNGTDYLFYDYITGDFRAFKTTGTIKNGETIINLSGDANNKFIFLNGQKIINGIDYLAINKISGDYNFSLKQVISKASGGGGEMFETDGYFGRDISINKDVSIIAITNPVSTRTQLPFVLTGSIGIYTGDKNNGWNLKQVLYGSGGVSSEIYFGSHTKFSDDGSVLAVSIPTSNSNIGQALFFTGSKNDNYVLKKQIASNWPHAPGGGSHRYSFYLNENANNILFGYNNTIPTSSNIFIYTGSKETDWNLKQSFTGNIFVANKNLSIIGIQEIYDFSPINNILIYTGSETTSWNLSQTISIPSGNIYSFGNDRQQQLAMDKEGEILCIGAGDINTIFIYNNINNLYSLVQTLKFTGYNGVQNADFGERLEISDNGRVILVTTNSGLYMYTGNNGSNFALKTQISDGIADFFPGQPNPNISNFAINNNGSLFIYGNPFTYPPPENTSIVSVFTGTTPIEYQSLITLHDISGENYFAIKHYPHYFNNYINTGDNLIFNNQWLFKQKFSGNNSMDNFGSSVISNDNANIIVIGELGDDPNNVTDVGSASIFTGNSNVGWEFKQKITGSGADSNFGYSLASSKNGNIIIMGGPEYDPLPGSQYLNAGGVAIFTGSFNTNWILKQIITGDTIGTVSNQNDNFGHSVTTNNDGSVIIVGVPSDNIRDTSLWPSTINDIGSAMIFTGNAINGWNFRQKITGNFIGSFFNFGYGYCVATNNDSSIIAMSGPSYSAFGNVAIFTGNAINGWNLKQIVSGNRAGGGFGESMSMNNNGDILVVGQPSFDVLSEPSIGNPGSILIFTGNAINGWGLKQDITGDWFTSTQGDLFGQRLSINENGNIITVTAPLDNNVGSINIFSGNMNSGWKSIQKIYNIVAYSLANSNDGKIIIGGGQYYDTNGLVNNGLVNIYELSPTLNSIINTNGTLKINKSYNHGCSQVYFNGIRQKINNNYIENSDFDLLSGSFNESDLKQDIYTNTDNFFVKI
jgi:hypothetical protein